MWKKFSFFSAELLQSADPGSPLYAIQALDVTCITSGRKNLVIGDSEGGITLCDEEFSLRRFIAHEGSVNFAYQYNSSNTLLTIGDGADYRSQDDVTVSRNLAKRFRANMESNETYKWMLDDLHINSTMRETFSLGNATLKLWLLDSIDENGMPLCLRTVKLFEKIEEETLTTLSVSEENQLLVFGCTSGHIYYLNGDLLRTKKLVPVLLPQSFSSFITCLSFSPSSLDASHLSLFAASNNRIGCFSIPVENKKNIAFQPLEEETGCAFHCGCIDKNGNFIAARDEGLFTYTPLQQDSSYLLTGSKDFIFSYRDSILLSEHTGDDHSIRIFNLKNTCEVFDMHILRNGQSESVNSVFIAWGLLFFMTESHVVYALREKETQAKLNLLYERELYPVALSFGKEWNLSEKEISEIHRLYGDWLYERKEFNDAMQEYIYAIGFIDASYVIRKYLDASQIHNLTLYLEELHRNDHATSDHTILLMNNYVKLHNNDKIQSFVYQSFLGTRYDVNAVIDVLSTAGYHREALYLARVNHFHERVLAILIDETSAIPDAIDYIATLPTADASKLMQRYGKRLMDAEPQATSALALRLCAPPNTADPEDFIQCFVDNVKQLKQFLSQVVQVKPDCKSVVWNTLLELLLRKDLAESEDPSALLESVMELLQNPQAAYDDDEALFLLEREGCHEGLLYVYTKLKLNGMLIQQYFEVGRRGDALALCEKEGKDESLWELLLQLYAQEKELDTAELENVISKVLENDRVSLLRVVQILSENEKVDSSMIRQIIMKQLLREKELREKDEKQAEELKAQRTKRAEELEQLKTQTQICKQSRCVSCGLPLERPVVYFRCGHCFHKACVDLTQSRCPKCESTEVKSDLNAKVKAEDLIRGLKQAQDGFAFAADCFGRDMFAEETESEPEAEGDVAVPSAEQFDDDDDNYVAEDITQSIHLL